EARRLLVVAEPFAGEAELAFALVEQQHRLLLAAAGLAGGIAHGVAVDDEQFLPAVEVGVEEGRAPTDVLLADQPDAGGGGAEGEECPARCEVVAVEGV